MFKDSYCNRSFESGRYLFHILGEQSLYTCMRFEEVAGWKSSESEQAAMKAQCYKGE